MKLKKISDNVTQITVGLLEVLVSYETPVACFDHGSHKGYKTEKKWSRTTSKHINQWFNLDEPRVSPIEDKPQEYFDNLLKAVA